MTGTVAVELAMLTAATPERLSVELTGRIVGGARVSVGISHYPELHDVLVCDTRGSHQLWVVDHDGRVLGDPPAMPGWLQAMADTWLPKLRGMAT